MRKNKGKNSLTRKRIFVASIAALMIAQTVTSTTTLVLANSEEVSYQSVSQENSGGIYIEKDGQIKEFDDLQTAIKQAENNDVIVLKQDVSTSTSIALDTNKKVTIQAEGNITIKRKNKENIPLIEIKNKGQLILCTKDENSSLTIDGENKDVGSVLVGVRENSYLQIEDGVKITRTRLPYAERGALINSGHVVMNGGEISNSYSAKYTGVNNQSGATFELKGGKITGNNCSHVGPGVYNAGVFKMSGGEISKNTTQWSDGGFTNAKGGVFEFTGGVIKENKSDNGNGVTLNPNSTMIMSGDAQVLGNNNILIKDGATLDVKGNLSSHSKQNPLGLLVGNVVTDRDVVRFDSEENATNAINYINAKYANNSQSFVLTNKKSDPKILTKIYDEDQNVLELLKNPYKDNLGFEFKDEFSSEEKIQQVKQSVERIFAGVESNDKTFYLNKIEYIERQIEYINQNKEKLQESVIVPSQLGDPWKDQQRTKQGYAFDNIDITGYYIQPGEKRTFNVYVDAQHPEQIQIAHRKAGEIDGNNYQKLSLSVIGNLKNGVNEITVDLSGTTSGHMLYIKNNSTDNPAKVRIEAIDANEEGKEVIVGTQLGQHPYYIHDTQHPEKFWDFVQELKDYAQKVNDKKAKDMTIIQMGDNGQAQFTMRAKHLKYLYEQEKINTEQKAIDYITKSNKAIQDRLEYFWKYEGYDKEDTGANAVSKMRVHTIFTKDIWSPSTMFAITYYFHMPESTAREFLNGNSMYGWGMSHEYGHMLDNGVISVAEETNNLYSIWGSRNEGFSNYLKTGDKNVIIKSYHPNIKDISIPRQDKLLKDRAKDSTATGGFNGGNGFYKVMTWYLGTHYFDGWDYSNYDYTSSPYTPELAQQVNKYGAYGTALRILRENDSKVKEITTNKYERMIVVFTMATGFNFGQYMQAMGQDFISPHVMAFCEKYPDLPTKVQYYSLAADAKELVGEKTYDGDVTPNMDITKNDDGSYTIKASMKTKEQQDATIAYELYSNGKLVDFSRDGNFTHKPENGSSTYQVIAYDYRVNASKPAKQEGIDVFSEIFYRGNEARIAEGEYPVIDFGNIKDNQVTAIKVPKGYTVELYAEQNFKGKKLILKDCELPRIGLNMDKDVSSIKVIKN